MTTPEGYDAILADIDAKLAAGRSVYVHCWGGVGRTGTVVGLVRVSRGADAGVALDAIRAARQGTRKAHRPAPEMDCQEEAIRQAAMRQQAGAPLTQLPRRAATRSPAETFQASPEIEKQ